MGATQTDAALLRRAIQAVPAPARATFSDAAGDPREPEDAPAVAAFATPAAEQLRLLAAACAAVPAAALGGEALDAAAAPTPRGAGDAPLPGLLVEELPEYTPENAAAGEDSDSNAPPAAAAALLAAALYGLDPGGTLARPWITPETDAAAWEVVSTLRARGVGVAVALPAALRVVGPTLTAAAAHAATETSRLDPYEGPDTWQRGLVAGQVAAAVLTLTADELWGGSGSSGGGGDLLWQLHLWPALSAALRDPSPVVQSHALWAVAHVAAVSDGRALAPWAAPLAAAVRDAAIGCDARAWPAAAAAAAAVGPKADHPTLPGPFAPRFLSIFEALLDEGERHAHTPARAEAWLGAVPAAFFGPMGVQLAAYFRRLMPLLLEWALARQKGVRMGALRALRDAPVATWPRAPAHAVVVWEVLERVYGDETALAAAPDEGAVAAAVTAAAMAWRCGGEDFQRRVQEIDKLLLEKKGDFETPTLLQRVLQEVKRQDGTGSGNGNGNGNGNGLAITIEEL